jgi:hypothetical protein
MRRLVLLAVLASLVAGEGEPPPPYEIEVLYAIHTKVTAESYKRIEALFARTYPKLDLSKLEESIREQREYFGLYRDRLLEQAGTSWDALRKADRAELAFDMLRPQIDRELRVRGMFRFWLEEAQRKGSVKAVFDALAAKDDPEHRVCATEPGKGLLVYRHITATGAELEKLEDGGVTFTHNFRFLVGQAANGELPRFAQWAGGLGPACQGRFVLRVLKVHRDPPPEKAK